MALFIAILEDDADRQAAMADCLVDRFPQYPIRFFATAVEMIWYLRQHLPEALAISLDHDLELVPVTNEAVLDGGSGRDVANYLASEPPTCPVVIHTTNNPAGLGMETALQEAGWNTARVIPYGDLDWIPELWLPTIRNAIVDAVPRPAVQLVPPGTGVD